MSRYNNNVHNNNNNINAIKDEFTDLMEQLLAILGDLESRNDGMEYEAPETKENAQMIMESIGAYLFDGAEKPALNPKYTSVMEDLKQFIDDGSRHKDELKELFVDMKDDSLYAWGLDIQIGGLSRRRKTNRRKTNRRMTNRRMTNRRRANRRKTHYRR